MSWEDWEDNMLDAMLEDREKANMKPYIISGMSDKQEDAIRDVAELFNFKDLRGFHMWMKSQSLQYYDIIKVKYSEA